MHSLFILIMGATLLIIQSTLLPLLPEWMGSPDLVLILVVFLATSLDTIKGAMHVLILGLLMDVFSGIFLGLFPVVYIILFFTIKAASKKLFIDEKLHQTPLIIFSYLYSSSILLFFCTIVNPDNLIEWTWRGLVLQMLILTIISVPLRHLYDILFPLFEQKASTIWTIRTRSNRFK